jgi:hypothetical protein
MRGAGFRFPVESVRAARRYVVAALNYNGRNRSPAFCQLQVLMALGAFSA